MYGGITFEYEFLPAEWYPLLRIGSALVIHLYVKDNEK